MLAVWPLGPQYCWLFAWYELRRQANLISKNFWGHSSWNVGRGFPKERAILYSSKNYIKYQLKQNLAKLPVQSVPALMHVFVTTYYQDIPQIITKRFGNIFLWWNCRLRDLMFWLVLTLNIYSVNETITIYWIV